MILNAVIKGYAFYTKNAPYDINKLGTHFLLLT